MSDLVFDRPTDTWQSRWAILRRFASVWCGITLAPATTTASRLAEATKIIGRTLPPSLREYIDFDCQLVESAGWGSGIDISIHPDIGCISFGSIETDWYYTIEEAHLHCDDPPVDGYVPSDTGREMAKLRRFGPVSSTLTGHVLLGMISPAQPRGGSFSVEVDPTDAWLEEMRSEFEIATTFGELLIFESPGRLVVIGNDPYLPTPESSMQGLWMEAADRIPACIDRWLQNGGGFSGRFAPPGPFGFRG